MLDQLHFELIHQVFDLHQVLPLHQKEYNYQHQIRIFFAIVEINSLSFLLEFALNIASFFSYTTLYETCLFTWLVLWIEYGGGFVTGVGFIVLAIGLTVIVVG